MFGTFSFKPLRLASDGRGGVVVGSLLPGAVGITIGDEVDVSALSLAQRMHLVAGDTPPRSTYLL